VPARVSTSERQQHSEDKEVSHRFHGWVFLEHQKRISPVCEVHLLMAYIALDAISVSARPDL
jgi:hypothetical protein